MTMTLDELSAGRTDLLHPGRNVTKADVLRVDVGGRRFAVKDYRARPAWVRATIGRWSLRREERAYRALDGVPGIPTLEGRPHPLVLVTRLVEGTSLAKWPRDRTLPDGFFGGLKDLVDEVHRHGVVQGDLHHRDVLVGEEGRAWLVDFSTGMVGGRSFGSRSIWRLLARLDRRAVLKLQERFEPGSLTAEERVELDDAPAVYLWVRRLTRVNPRR